MNADEIRENKLRLRLKRIEKRAFRAGLIIGWITGAIGLTIGIVASHYF